MKLAPIVALAAGRVVVSLWQIDDEATTFLMERFYDHLQATRDESVALRHAMLDTREKYPQPALWAGFTSIGGPRKPAGDADA